ncbi:hypothetical protein SDJN03_17037, partial [Cucurbita argyrosperma subsp. sororia]
MAHRSADPRIATGHERHPAEKLVGGLVLKACELRRRVHDMLFPWLGRVYKGDWESDTWKMCGRIVYKVSTSSHAMDT